MGVGGAREEGCYGGLRSVGSGLVVIGCEVDCAVRASVRVVAVVGAMCG